MMMSLEWHDVMMMQSLTENIWQPRDKTEKEPIWLKTEKEQFGTHKDRNGDGKLDRKEIEAWLYPENYDRYEAEANHLMYHGDSDKVRTRSIMY